MLVKAYGASILLVIVNSAAFNKNYCYIQVKKIFYTQPFQALVTFFNIGAIINDKVYDLSIIVSLYYFDDRYS